MLFKYTLLLAQLAIPTFSYASEGNDSQYLPGFFGDSGMAVTAPSGYYVDNYLGYRRASSAGLGYDVFFELPGMVSVTDTKIAGGTYTFAFYPSALYTELRSTTDGTITRAARGGVGNMYAVPIKLTWDWENISLGLFSGIVIPTGSFNKDRLSGLNSGRNYWTFDNNAVLTWHSNGYELSLDAGYMVNTQNKATHYRTGDELHLNYFLAYSVTDNMSMGISGSYYRQLLSDTGSNKDVATSIRGEANGIGPVITYNKKIADKNIYFSVKWLHEYNVNNRIPTDYFMLRTAFKF